MYMTAKRNVKFDGDFIHAFIYLNMMELHFSHNIPEEIEEIIIDYLRVSIIVMDNGSALSKVGFSGDSAPHKVFPTVVGRPRHSQLLSGDIYIGNKALEKREFLTMKRPIEWGIVTNWDDLTAIWDHTFKNELNTDTEGSYIIMSEAPIGGKNRREKMTQIMFEQFKVNGFYVALSEVLALYASGRTTGIVLSSGYDATHTVPIYEGYALPHAQQRMDVGGSDVTEYLMKLTAKTDMQIVQDIKETLCYVAKNYEDECNKEHGSEQYELPDGTMIEVGKERFEAPECLFVPNKIGKGTGRGVHNILNDSIMKCDVDVRRDLFENMVLNGGNTMFAGFAERVQLEIASLCTQISVNVNVIASPDRNYGVWIGASILSSLSNFEDMWITKEEYEESGPAVVHRKCI